MPALSGEATAIDDYLHQAGFSPDTLRAALEIKRIAGQVSVLVHAANSLASRITSLSSPLHATELTATMVSVTMDAMKSRRITIS